MKSYLPVIALVLLAPVLASAQTANPNPQQGQQPNQQGQNRIPRPLVTLNLTPVQQQEVSSIISSTPAGPERRQKIMAILTPEQQEQLKKEMKEHQRKEGQQGNVMPVPQQQPVVPQTN